MEERLQKVMAHAGVASRRTCEEMIQQGRVRVNGKVVSELGTKVDPTRDIVLVDGNPITGPEAPRYIVLYKPTGYLSAMEPEGGRPCLADLVQVPQRLYPVGRLDLESEGLMLLTNDGELAHRLTHPRYQHPKEYLVLIEGRPSTIALRKLRQGVDVADRLTAPAEVTIVDGPPAFLARPDDARPVPTTWLYMILREGRKREIRHMTAAVGHPTLRLIRTGLGPLRLERMKPGHWRDVNARELRSLRRLLRPAGAAPRGQRGQKDETSRPAGPSPARSGRRPPRASQPADQPPRAGGSTARSARPTRAGASPPGRSGTGRPPTGKPRPGSDTRPAPDRGSGDRPPPRRGRPASQPGTGQPPRDPTQASGPADRAPDMGDRPPRQSGRPAGRGTPPSDRRDRPAAGSNRPSGASRGGRPAAGSSRSSGAPRGGRTAAGARRPSGASPGGRSHRRSGKKRPPV